MQPYKRVRRKTRRRVPAKRRARIFTRHRAQRGGEAPKKKVAILFFGLTRALKKTVENYKKNLFDVLTANNIDYDIFIHTYTINGPYHNEWAGEHTESYENEDVEALLHPKYSLKDDQNAIAATIPFNDYYTNLGNWTGMTEDMTKYLIRNLCLALYSKKQITKLFETVKGIYDYAIFARPELYLETPIDVNWLQELNDSKILVPEADNFTGTNDRFCIGTPAVILYVGTLFDSLLEYSRRTNITSERYLHDKLREKNIEILKKDIKYQTLRMHTQPEQQSPS
jgi:hypothetical protein